MTTVIDQGLIDKQFIIMVMGAAILITLTMISLRKHYQSTQGPSWLVTLLSLEHLITVAFVTLMLYLFKPEFIAQFQQVSELSFVLANPELLETHFTFAQLMSSVPLMLTLWFIVVTDIPGTPPVVLPKTMLEKNREVYENRGFKNDSVFTFISPLLGTTPTIYYAENQLLNEGNRYNKGIGLTVAGLFLLCLLALIGAQYSGYYTVNLDRIIPPLAVAPVLFYIGLFVIASSFINDSDIDKQDKHQGDFRFYLPAALAVVLTPFVGPQYSFPITILSYWITGAHFQKKAHPSFILISCGAIFTLLIYVSLLFLK
jgi:xanthine/uracil permease